MAPGRLLAAVASTQLLLVESLRSRPQPQRNLTVDFVACDEPEPCGSENLTSHYLLDLLKRVEPVATRVKAEGRTPTMLHIGSADLGNRARFADIDLYTKVNSFFSDALQETYKLVLVDPNDAMFAKLRENARGGLPIPLSQVEIIHGMVAASCESTSAKMYRLSKRVEEEFGVPWSVYGTWFSSDRDFPMRALRWVSKMEKVPWFLNEQQFHGLQRLKDLNASDYVVGIEVPCYTPASLLEKVGAKASDLAMVVVDAESTDRFIVANMLELPGFKPGYLQWEGTLTNRKMRPVALDAQARGFEVGNILTTSDDSDANNIVATPAQ